MGTAYMWAPCQQRRQVVENKNGRRKTGLIDLDVEG